jgi:phospholipase A2-like protein
MRADRLSEARSIFILVLAGGLQRTGGIPINEEKNRMKKKLVTALVALSATAGALAPATAMAVAPEATAAPTAQVAPAAAACSPKCAARAVTLERVYGPLYGRYKEIYPNRLYWDNNGCSFPKWMYEVRGLGWAVKHYSGKLQKSCDRHDFGYGNHGKSGLSRLTVDQRFLSNMRYQCERIYDDWYDLPARALCNKAAGIMYKAVRLFGGSHW